METAVKQYKIGDLVIYDELYYSVIKVHPDLVTYDIILSFVGSIEKNIHVNNLKDHIHHKDEKSLKESLIQDVWNDHQTQKLINDIKNEECAYILQEKTSDTVVLEVIEDLTNRSLVGIEKYNTTLDRTDIDLKGWLSHAYEEALDHALYLKRAMREL